MKYRIIITHSNEAINQPFHQLVDDEKNLLDRIDFMVHQLNQIEGWARNYNQHSTVVSPSMEKQAIILTVHLWIETDVCLYRVKSFVQSFFQNSEVSPAE